VTAKTPRRGMFLEEGNDRCSGWLGHPLAQRRHDHPIGAA